MTNASKNAGGAGFIVRLAATLLAISGLVGAALAGINAMTASRIADIKTENTNQAIEAVLPGGGSEVAFTDSTGLVSKVYASDSGYAVQVAPAGFGGAIDMMVGVDNSGTVLGISIISHTETAGLGAVAAADTSAGEAFRSEFVGLSGTVAVNKDGGEVDAITGATITSRAVATGVNAALACVAGLN